MRIKAVVAMAALLIAFAIAGALGLARAEPARVTRISRKPGSLRAPRRASPRTDDDVHTDVRVMQGT